MSIFITNYLIITEKNAQELFMNFVEYYSKIFKYHINLYDDINKQITYFKKYDILFNETIANNIFNIDAFNNKLLYFTGLFYNIQINTLIKALLLDIIMQNSIKCDVNFLTYTNWNNIIADNDQDDEKRGFQHLKFYSQYLRKTYSNIKDVNMFFTSWDIYYTYIEKFINSNNYPLKLTLIINLWLIQSIINNTNNKLDIQEGFDYILRKPFFYKYADVISDKYLDKLFKLFMIYLNINIKSDLLIESPNLLDDNDGVRNFFLVNGESFLYSDYRLITQDIMYMKGKALLIDFIYKNYNHHNIKKVSLAVEKIIGDILVYGNYKNEIVKFTCEYYFESFQDNIDNICKWNELPSYDDIDFPKTYLLYRLINIKHNCKYLQ
jgi:hypothetical protein